MAQKFWLFKSEPGDFSLDDLKNSENQTTSWDGVRNYQARNFIRDDMKVGDKVLFYHSNSQPAAVVGVCSIVKDPYADHTQFDPENKHFYPSSVPDKPAWYMVDIKFEKEFKNPVTLDSIKQNPLLKDMLLVRKGNRLSVMPVSKTEFNEIVKMSKK